MKTLNVVYMYNDKSFSDQFYNNNINISMYKVGEVLGLIERLSEEELGLLLKELINKGIV